MSVLSKLGQGIGSLFKKTGDHRARVTEGYLPPRLGVSRHDAPEVQAKIREVAARSDLSLEQKQDMAKQIRAAYRKKIAPSPDIINATEKRMLQGEIGDVMHPKYDTKNVQYGTDPYTTFYLRTPEQRAAVELLTEAVKKTRPDLKSPGSKAQFMLKEIRDNFTYGSPGKRLTKLEKDVAKIMKDASMLGTTGALAKMAEATMVPEPSFGEKTGEFLMDWLQPLPRSWGQADPKMRVD